MKKLLIAAATLNQTPLDLDGNIRRILDVVESTRSDTAILCMPEMCITGYGCEDAFFYNRVQERAFAALETIAHHALRIIPETLVAVGLPVMFNNALYNVCALLGGGRTIALIPKQNLCADGVHYETRWFKPWPRGRIEHHKKSPIGDLLVDYAGTRVGIEICEDAWAADRPGVSLSQRGVDIILNPSASHFALGKSWIRKRFVIEGSRAFGCAYVFANLLGNEAGRIVYDGERLVATGGRLIAQGERLTFDDFAITEAVIDVDENRTRRIQSASTKMGDNLLMMCSFSSGFLAGLPNTPPHLKKNRTFQVESPPSDTEKFEEFTAAVSLGLWDYMRKTRSSGFVLSISGGVDSAVCAVLVKEMIERCGKPPIGTSILTCVYQATKNSSDTTREAARSVAEGLGFEFVVWEVERFVEGYSSLVEKAIGRELEWTKDDIAMQNVQARIRAPGIWMLANIKNAILLTTSNRSEAAVGYATMDGDTCGGLAPIAGIGKPFLIDWLTWMAEHKYPCLGPVLALKPTAELRPLVWTTKQTDEDDLMPYPLLEAIQRAAIRDKLSPDEIYEQLRDEWNVENLRGCIDKFFSLWQRNQWKRERYAPAFHVDDESLDPKTWCRFPILSGGLS